MMIPADPDRADDVAGELLQPDPEWPERKVRRMYEALVVLAEAGTALRRDELRERVAARVSVLEWDRSTSSSGAVRAWTNMEFRLSTVIAHAGWMHRTSNGGARLTREGGVSLGRGTVSWR
jgi:5-methylcytosine-specific restriction protein B